MNITILIIAGMFLGLVLILFTILHVLNVLRLRKLRKRAVLAQQKCNTNKPHPIVKDYWMNDPQETKYFNRMEK